MGAVKLIIGFIFFILSFIFAYLIFIPVTDVMNEYISYHIATVLVSITLSYTICAIFCSLIAKQLKTLVEDISGGLTDRLLGLVLGAARGIIASLIIFALVTIFTNKTYLNAKNLLDLLTINPHVESPKWVSSSKLSPELKYLFTESINSVGKEALKQVPLPVIHTQIIEPDQKEHSREPFDSINGITKQKIDIIQERSPHR